MSGSLPPLRRGDEVADLRSGVTFRVPEGWEADSRTGLAQAGRPANRELDYTNVLVVTHVDNGKGKIIRLPAEWSDWLRARRDLSVRRVGPVTVDGKTGTIIHVATRKDEVAVFCPGNDPDLCFFPGRGGVDYALVDLEPVKLLLIEGPSPASSRSLSNFPNRTRRRSSRRASSAGQDRDQGLRFAAIARAAGVSGEWVRRRGSAGTQGDSPPTGRGHFVWSQLPRDLAWLAGRSAIATRDVEAA